MTTTTKRKMGPPFRHHKKVEKIVTLLKEGWSLRLIAQKTNVSKSYVGLIKKDKKILSRTTKRLKRKRPASQKI